MGTANVKRKWDISLRAPLRRVVPPFIIWLRESVALGSHDSGFSMGEVQGVNVATHNSFPYFSTSSNLTDSVSGSNKGKVIHFLPPSLVHSMVPLGANLGPIDIMDVSVDPIDEGKITCVH
ncbi:hypothetical protein V6N12_069509 [Hibiscus sabdariffa]|uniref:Uncharacterized protein n=1 Tax=Hibiscus sabdariffa TaxID=183260 RepID=A0ABR2FE86_9ROSI